MIIDVHVHIGSDTDGNKQSIATLRKNMKKYDIDAAVVFPFNSNGNLIEDSLNLLKYRSDSIYPFLRFDPKTMKVTTLRELLTTKGFAGIKLHPRSQNFDPLDHHYYSLYKEVENTGKPILFHTRKENLPYSDPDRVVTLANDFPELNIIIGHFAGASDVAIAFIKDRDNLFLETSGLSTNHVIKMTADKIGTSKIIFGSDAPLSDQEIELLKIKKSGLSKTRMEKILSKNLLSLLKL